MSNNIKADKKTFREVTVKESKEINGGIRRRRIFQKPNKLSKPPFNSY